MLGEPMEDVAPRPSAARRILRPSIGHIRRYLQVDFGASGLLAPDRQMRTDFCCALTHPEKPKVSRPSARVEHLGTDALAVVADSDLQRGFGVGHFRFDVLGARMP